LNFSSASNRKIEWSECNAHCLSSRRWVTVPYCEHCGILIVSIGEIDAKEVLDCNSWIGSSWSDTLLFLSGKRRNTVISLILYISWVHGNTFIVWKVRVCSFGTSHRISIRIAAQRFVCYLIVSLCQIVSVLVLTKIG